MLPFISSCVSTGTSIRIVTDEPAEHFVVECEKSKDYLIGHNASSYTVTDNIIIAKSGEDVSCGLLLSGNSSRAKVHHPIYKFDRSEPGKNVDRVVYMVPSLDKINELEMQYIAGQFNTPSKIDEYSLKVSINTCAVSKRYLELFSKAGTPDYQQFSELYYEATLECMKKAESIRHDLGRSPEYFYFGKKGYQPELVFDRWMDDMWGFEYWKPYLKGTEEDNNRLVDRKPTYLVAYNHPEGGGVWLLLDAYSKEQIKQKYPELEPLDKRPEWMSAHREKSIVKDCNNKDLHWDIDEPATGWLLEHQKDKLARPCEKTKYLHMNQGVIR